MRLKLLGTTCIAIAALIMPARADMITIKVDATPSIFAGLFNELKSKFEAEHAEIRLELDTSQRDQTDMIQRTMRQAIVGGLPDVSMQGFNYLKMLADGGHIQAVDSLISADADWTKEQYSSSVTGATTLDGKTYGVSLAYSFPIIFYNEDLVAKAQNGSKTLPGNWEGILALAEKIQSAEPGVLGAYTRYNSFMSQGHIMSRGGSLGNADGTAVTFTDPKGMEAFKLYHRFGELGQSKVDMTDAQARQAFASGKIAVFADSSSSLESFSKQAAGKFAIGTAHLPFSEGAKLPTSGIAAVMHTKDDARQKASWTFMAYLASPEIQSIIARRTGYVPANEVAVERAELLGDYYKANPAINGTLASIPYAQAWYTFKGQNAARIDKLFADRLQQVVTLQISPEDAANELKSEITKLIQK